MSFASKRTRRKKRWGEKNEPGVSLESGHLLQVESVVEMPRNITRKVRQRGGKNSRREEGTQGRKKGKASTHLLAPISRIFTALIPNTSAHLTGSSIKANLASFLFICSIIVSAAASRISFKNLTVPRRVDIPVTGTRERKRERRMKGQFGSFEQSFAREERKRGGCSPIPKLMCSSRPSLAHS